MMLSGYPGFHVSHPINGASTETEFSRNRYARPTKPKLSADVFYNLPIQFSIAVRFAVRIALFVLTIIHVLALSTKKQMRRINASPIVTGMQYEKSVLNSAISQFITKAMRAKAFFGNLNHAITTVAHSTIPQPALVSVIGNGNLLPKSFNRFWGILRGSHRVTPLAQSSAVTSSAGTFTDASLYHIFSKFVRVNEAQQ